MGGGGGDGVETFSARSVGAHAIIPGRFADLKAAGRSPWVQIGIGQTAARVGDKVGGHVVMPHPAGAMGGGPCGRTAVRHLARDRAAVAGPHFGFPRLDAVWLSWMVR